MCADPDADLSPTGRGRNRICSAEAERLRSVDEAVGSPGPFGSNTGSNLSWQLAIKWLTTCVSSHPACKPPSVHSSCSLPPRLPTRVIDVGFGNGNGSDILHPPRLLVVAEDTPREPYATMSHRWSSHPPFKLLKDNLLELTKEIPLAALPKVFQDAFDATRRLGLRYIWIDSICIIQDSEEDWHRESANMNAIYTNSHCNIAAADAATGEETQEQHGCFFDRDPSALRPSRFHVNWSQLCGISGNYYAASAAHRFSKNVTSSPLCKRAWAYQERVLSPRIIHCCSKQLFWECHTLRASESYPFGLPHALDHDGVLCDSTNSDSGVAVENRPWYRNTLPDYNHSRLLKDGGTAGSDVSTTTLADALAIWNRALKEYSRLELSNPARDRLVAISGVAENLSKHMGTGSRYIAGLWQHPQESDGSNLKFAEQLLWKRDNVWDSTLSFVIEPTELSSGAPSWSWASISGAIAPELSSSYDDKNTHVLIDVLEAKAELVDESCPFGAVKGGGGGGASSSFSSSSLCIRGHLLDSDTIDAGELGDPLDRDLLDGHLVWDSEGEIPLNSGTAGNYTLDTITKRDAGSGRGLWFYLPVIYDLRNPPFAAGLILERVNGDGSGSGGEEEEEEENVFKRVGRFEVPETFSAYDNPNSMPDFQELFTKANGRDDDGPFPEWGRKRTITIV